MSIRRLNIFVVILLITSQLYSQCISINGGFGQLVPHHQSMIYLIQGHAQSIQLNYSELTSNQQTISYHGGAMYTGNSKILGTIFYAYTSLDNKLGKKKLDEFSIGLGLGYASRTFDPNLNNHNIAIGSHFNAAIEFAYQRTILNNKNLNWSIGAAFKHFSNGSYQTPNLGLNFFTFNSTFGINLKDKIPELPFYRDTSEKLNKVVYSSIGIHENVNPNRGKYPLVTLGFGITKKLKKQLRPIIGIDGFYNPANTHFDANSSSISPFQAGFYIGNNFDLSLIKIGVNMGVYTFNEYKLRGIIYHKLVIDRQINRNFSAQLVLKSHWAVAESFMIGIGYKF